MKTEVRIQLSTFVAMRGLLSSWEVLAPRHRLITSIGWHTRAPFMDEPTVLRFATKANEEAPRSRTVVL